MARFEKDTNDKIYEIASAALLEALNSSYNVDTPEKVRRYIQEEAGRCEGIGDYTPGDILAAYDRAGAFLHSSGYSDTDPDFDWSFGTKGTLQNLICLGAVFYIAEVAARLFEQEYAATEREPDLQDYPLQRQSRVRRPKQ